MTESGDNSIEYGREKGHNSRAMAEYDYKGTSTTRTMAGVQVTLSVEYDRAMEKAKATDSSQF